MGLLLKSAKELVTDKGDGGHLDTTPVQVMIICSPGQSLKWEGQMSLFMS